MIFIQENADQNVICEMAAVLKHEFVDNIVLWIMKFWYMFCLNFCIVLCKMSCYVGPGCNDTALYNE